MNIKNIAQFIFRTMYLFMAMGFISCSSADQSILMKSNNYAPFSKDVPSIDYYFYQTPAYQTENNKTEFAFRKSKEISEQRIGSFIYKTIENPNKVQKQIIGTAVLYGLDGMGLGESVREGIYFIKKNTRYSLGDCGELRFKTNRITASSCLRDGGFVELNSNYNFNSVQLQFKWPI